MRLLHYVEIENFKRFASRQHIDLEHPSVLIGPNNCGKTSILQAIALWSIALKTWTAETLNSKAEVKKGKALNRLNILSVPVPKTRHFWNNLRVSGRELRITVGVDLRGTAHPVTMIFRHHASDELVYCEPTPESISNEEAMRAASSLDLALLYPMSGISSDEAVILPQRIEFFLGRGSTAEVLRNICLQVHQTNPGDWNDIVSLMRRLFQVDVHDPKVNEKGGVDLTYQQDKTQGEMDLGLSGRGFQQMLLIFAHLYLHKNSVLLIDEPDAHLEILRQHQVYVLLRDIAARNGSQVVIVTHSEVLLREALDTNLSLIINGQTEKLSNASNPEDDVRKTLKHYGTEHYVRARETGHVLYLEGSTDLDLLRAFARRLRHPVADLLEDGSKLNVYFLQDNFPGADRSTDAELQRVEGGFGLTARDHFSALRKMLPGLRGLAIQDGDGKGREDDDSGGFKKRIWRRYEAENYFVTPELLLARASHNGPQVELFQELPSQILQQLLLEEIFDGSQEDLANFNKADPSTRRTLWRAQTQTRKLSAFAEEFFRRLALKTAMPMLCRKNGLHELVALSDPADLNGDVMDKLNDVRDLLAPSKK